MYLPRIPFWLKFLIPDAVYHGDRSEDAVYLTFDDGPVPEVTPFVLEELAKANARATFFQVGENAVKYPELALEVKQRGHLLGNHTQHHLNGWDTKAKQYLDDVLLADEVIDSKFFRPPYGKIGLRQNKLLKQQGFQLVMWSLLSGDFDQNKSPQDCIDLVLKNLKPGDIVVFHDSVKAFDRLKLLLPAVLDFCQKRNWKFKTINEVRA